MGKKFLFSVAVSRAEGVAELPGAITASDEIIKWGRNCGYETFSITDVATNGDLQPVTIDLIKDKLSPTLNQHAGDISSFIFHFAGHGLFSGAGGPVLLLSKWNSVSNQSISVIQFDALLDYFKIDARTLILDACSERISNDTQHVYGASIVDKDPINAKRFQNSEKVQLRAAADGELAYMLKGNPPQDPICLFTGSLLKVLAGHDESAGQDINFITISKFVKNDFPHIANKYNLSQQAIVNGGLYPPNDIYATSPTNYTAPTLPSVSEHIAQSVGQKKTTENFENSNGVVLDVPSEGISHTILEGMKWAADWLVPSFPTSRSQSEHSKDNQVEIIRGGSGKSPPKSRTRGFQLQASLERETETNSTTRAGTHPQTVFISNTKINEKSFKIVDYQQTMNLHDTTGVRVQYETTEQDRTNDDTNSVEPVKKSKFENSILLLLPGERTIAAYKYPNSNLIFTLDEGEKDIARGGLAFNFSPKGQAATGVDEDFRDTFIRLNDDAVSLTDIKDASITYRHGKHINPMRGIMAAYLSSAIGDVQTVRRIAWFYYQRGQPVPFDIALLADVEGKIENGSYAIDIPETPNMTEYSTEESHFSGYQRETSAAKNVPVAGCYPIMTQGWMRLPYAVLPVNQALISISKYLDRNYVISTFGREGSQELIKFIQR